MSRYTGLLSLIEALTHTAERHAAEPLVVLDCLSVIADQAEAGRIEAIAQARGQRCSWTQIGEAMGLSKQAAHKRYAGQNGPSDARTPPDGPDQPLLPYEAVGGDSASTNPLHDSSPLSLPPQRPTKEADQ